MKTIKLLALVGGLMSVLPGGAFGANPIDATQAKRAVGNFVRRAPRPMGSPAAGTVIRVETERQDGEDLFHVAYLSDGGYVVTSADRDISPIMAIGDGNAFAASDKNPIYSLLRADLLSRKQALDKGTRTAGRLRLASVSSASASKSAAAEAWDRLLTPISLAEKKSVASKRTSLTDVRVAPLLKTKWDQTTWGKAAQNGSLYDLTSTKVYNLYTPNSWACGCVATAMAQIMAYWKYPAKSPSGKTRWYMYVDGDSLKCGEAALSGAEYPWSQMPVSYEACKNITATQAAYIGRVTRDAGLSVRMMYTDSGSSTETLYEAEAFINCFGYASASVYGFEPQYQYAGEALNADYSNAIFSNLDAAQPVGLSIHDPSAGGHSVVGDGYGVYDGCCYVHINCGWSGFCDAWYALPDGSGMAGYKNFRFDPTIFKGVVFNVNPTNRGDIVSGRVLDESGNAVGGVAVKLADSAGKVLQTAKSNASGIYWFRVNAAGTYGIAASQSETVCSKSAKVVFEKITPFGVSKRDIVKTANGNELVKTHEEANFVGNKWGVDLYLQNAAKEKVEESESQTVALPVFSPAGGEFEERQAVSLSCGTISSTIRYTTDGSEPTENSVRYTSPVTVTKSTTFKARAFREGWTPSGTAMAVFTKKVTPAVKLPTPMISPSESRFVGSCTVTLSCSDANATIYYTTDGSVPTAASTKYAKPFVVTRTGDFTVNAIACRTGNYTASDVATKTYTVTAKTKVQAPVLSPASGTFALNATVLISGDTSLSTLRYTTDGTRPTASSPVYAAPIFVTKATTVRAIAIPKDSTKYLASDPVVGQYAPEAAKTVNAALNNTKVVFRTSTQNSASHVEYVENDDTGLYTHDGSAALRFVTDSEAAADAATLSADLSGPGLLTFWMQGDVTRTVSGNRTTTSISDTMTFLLDGTRKSLKSTASDICWTQYALIVPDGSHTVTWKCGYNARKARGRGVLDCVEWLSGSELPEIRISYDANGASGSPSVAVTVGTLCSTVNLAEVGTMQRSGRRFMGWNTKADGSGKMLSGGAKYEIMNRDDCTLYAIWQELVPIYREVPYDATNVVFEIPAEFGSSWSLDSNFSESWVKRGYTLLGYSSATATKPNITISIGAGHGRISLGGCTRFELGVSFSDINDSTQSRTFEFPIYPHEYRRAPVFTVIQLPDRETDKLAGINLAGSKVANDLKGQKLACTAVLRNGSRIMPSKGVTWKLAAADQSVATVDATGLVKAKATLTAPRTVTACASYTDGDGYSAEAGLKMTLAPEVGLGAAMNAGEFEWKTFSGANAWYGQTAVGASGKGAAMAGSAYRGSPRMSTTVGCAGTACFKAKVDGSSNGGTLWLIVDEGTSNVSTNFCATFLPDTPSEWIDRRIEVRGGGEHTLTFLYVADGGTCKTPDDNAYVADFSYEMDATIPYTIRFAANGGTGTLSPMTCYYGKAYRLNRNLFSKTGKRFAGWQSSIGGKNVKRYDDGMLVYNLAYPGETVTMTAIWE